MSLLELRDLKKTYASPDGETTTVVDVRHFVVAPGEQVALRGESGSGKTTLLNLIAGLLTPDGGQILLDGTDMARLSEPARDHLRAQTLGYVFQTFNLLQGYTALENVLLGMMFGPGPDPRYARELLERVGLGDRLRYRPRALSVGQQQRVAVARALANRPRLLLADEPTGNLDPVRAVEAIDLIRGICEESGAALLLVSHDPRILERFDRVERIEEIAGGAHPDGPVEAAR
jgi:putative ABC transport system ATP-binding protein